MELEDYTALRYLAGVTNFAVIQVEMKLVISYFPHIRNLSDFKTGQITDRELLLGWVKRISEAEF